jgi:uncharacterized protein (DUF983 family)
MPAAAVPVWRAGLLCRCPRCGQGALFSGVLSVRERCAVCGLDLREHDSGDGPAVLVFFVLASVVIALVFWVEFTFSPPLWVHAVLWPLVTIPLAVALMRPTKATMVALQFKLRASEMGL